ncbi:MULTISPECIES: hypothetical protein, partial [unclassified Bradyrhizobium]|uniref:hypothetical protein n=1 Tax=unclassified Bradyrhizobium TaxID=2631580 RepID=UPI00236388A7
GAVPTSVLKAQVGKAAPGGSARTASLLQKAVSNLSRVQGGQSDSVPTHFLRPSELVGTAQVRLCPPYAPTL